MSKPARSPRQVELFTRVQILIDAGGVDAEASPRPWFVYLLECNGGRIYTGIAVDVAKRLTLHQNGKGASFTRMHVPQALLASFKFPDRAAASRAEAAFKRLGAAQKRTLIPMQVGFAAHECAVISGDVVSGNAAEQR